MVPEDFFGARPVEITCYMFSFLAHSLEIPRVLLFSLRY